MRDSSSYGKGGSGRRRPLRLAGPILVALLAAVLASAGGSGRAHASAARAQTIGVATITAAITPRVVQPVNGPPGSVPGDREPEVGDGVPPGLDGGIPTTGLPSVAGDTTQFEQPPPNIVGGVGPAVANGSFDNLQAINGASWLSTGCGCEPPDTQMAAGTNEIVEAVNNNVFVYSRGGTLLGSYPLTQVFQPPGQNVGLTDPKIVFDASTGRYYMVEMVCQDKGCGAPDYTHMGISLATSSNPLSSWTVYDYLNDGQDLQDQEKLGFSGDKITFAVNEYGCKCGAGTSFKQENVVVVQKSDVVAGNSITPAVFSANSFSSYIFDSMPTTPVNASTSDNTQYVVWDKNATSSNQMAVVRITGTPNASNVNFTSSVNTINIANQTAPPTPAQQGGTLAGDKQNLQSATVQGNNLWAVATDGCTPPGGSTLQDCTRLLEVNLGSNSVSVETDVGTNGTDRINPSVSVDGSGRVFFGFTISSSTSRPTAALDASALPLPSVLQRIDFASGDAKYTGGRWGDYSGTQQDPSNTNDMWTAQEIGGCSSSCGSAFWGTELGQFTFRDPHITSISPTSGPDTGGTTVDIFGSEFANNGTSVFFGANASPTVTWVDSTHIKAVSPPGATGTVDVTASTGTGTSDTSAADHFTYGKVTPSLSTQASGAVTVGGSVSDTATISGGFSPTGTITFNLYGPGNTSCSGSPVATSVKPVSGNGQVSSSSIATSLAGTYRWTAVYSGDANNNGAATGCNDPNESVTVNQAHPTLTSTASPNVTLGGPLFDTGTLAGGFNPTGSITFRLYGTTDPTCSAAPVATFTVSVSGNGSYPSPNASVFFPGTYRWVASYSGDVNNVAIASPCGAANESITLSATKSSPTLTTQASGNVKYGGSVSDTATLAGGNIPTGTITFRLYGPFDTTCSLAPLATLTVTVSGNGSYPSGSFTPMNTGTMRWVASYSGDASNNAATAPCNAPNESVTVAPLFP